MDNLPFADKFGRMRYCEPAEAFVREKSYIIIKQDSKILCIYDAASELFSLPTEYDIELNAVPTRSFTVLSYIFENNRPIKETQKYRFYDIKNADLNNTPLQWCALEDISLRKIMFDATQLGGIKHMMVRINDNAENL